MKILVCFKVLPNPDGILEEDWNSFSLSSDLSYAGLDYNCFDASALEIGLKIKDHSAVQGAKVTCTALSVSSRITPKFAQGLYSVGFDEVITLKLNNREFKSREVARLIANYAKKIGADIVLTGAQAGNAESGMVPYYISHFLDYPIISNVETANYNNDKIVCNVREDGGLIEKTAAYPLVICVNNSPEVLRFATLKARMACRTKQAEVIEVIDSDDSEVSPILSRPKTGRNCTYLENDSDESVKKVLDILKQFSSGESESTNNDENINSHWSDFLKQRAVLIKSNCFCAEESRELLQVYEKDKKDLVVLSDDSHGRALAIKLSERENIDCFFSADIEDITSDCIKIKKHVCASNLEWHKTLKYPCVITASNSEIEKLRDIKTVLLCHSECDKLNFIESTKVIEKAQPTALKSASVVIACGAGMGNKAACDKVRVLAQKLGAGFGLTRPSALNAWGSPTEIIGQSGSLIAPECCLVLGAAGAGAFMLGIEKSKKIIAVNTDTNALIFKNADIGINCDAQSFVDKLLSLLEQEKY